MGRIKREKEFTDSYFPGLEESLKEMHKHYAYLPKFSSTLNNKDVLELYRVLKILKRKNIAVICEFQLLSIHDFLYLIYFILTYPFHLLNFINTLKEDVYEIHLIKYELLDSIGQVTFYNFSRYLQGRRIAKLPYGSIKVISWYENLPLDKNLYKGLRTDTSDKVKIYGAQLLLYSKNYLFIIPDENEEIFGVTPDRIIESGPYYVPEKTSFNYIVGPSLRYTNIFGTLIQKEKQKNILVLLSYLHEELIDTLAMLQNIEIKSGSLLIKVHPATSLKKYRRLIPSNARIVDEDMYKLFETAKIVISAGSGTLIEAASLGIPVIAIKNPRRFIYNNTLPDYGKGVIWEDADNPQDLIRKIEKLEYNLNNNFEEISEIANRYKNMFFCEPTPDAIAKAFDL